MLQSHGEQTHRVKNSRLSLCSCPVAPYECNQSSCLHVAGTHVTGFHHKANKAGRASASNSLSNGGHVHICFSARRSELLTQRGVRGRLLLSPARRRKAKNQRGINVLSPQNMGGEKKKWWGSEEGFPPTPWAHKGVLLSFPLAFRRPDRRQK